MRHTKSGKIISSLLFCALVALPLLNQIFGFVSDSKNLENRKMKAAPILDINYLDPFPASYELYYNDNFLARNRLLKNYNDFKLQVFHKSAFPDRVVIGNDHWLFLAQNDIDVYTGKNAFTEDELQAFKVELEYRQAVLDSFGIKMVFMIAPGKPNIYKEQVPFSLHRYSNKGWGEQVVDYLEENSSVRQCNLFSVLRSKKKKHMLYYKLDTHWNSWGAYFAADTFVKYTRSIGVSNLPSLPEFYQTEKKIITEGNCSKILGYPQFYTDTDYVLRPSIKSALPHKFSDFEYHQIGKQRPYLLVCGDSFNNWFMPIAASSFGRVGFQFDTWQYGFGRDFIVKEKPDVFLIMIHEPLLRKMLENRSGPK